MPLQLPSDELIGVTGVAATKRPSSALLMQVDRK